MWVLTGGHSEHVEIRGEVGDGVGEIGFFGGFMHLFVAGYQEYFLAVNGVADEVENLLVPKVVGA